MDRYRRRVERCIDRALPPDDAIPQRLHAAMRYAVMNGGKRMRPLLVYASGECLGISPERLDAPAAAIELIHAFSLVHDDLPAMDDDDLRRGKPTVHCEFGEATAILAGDALLPLAFGLLAGASTIADPHKAALATLLAQASGSLGMTGGQAIDLAAEGRRLAAAELERMHNLKTGALIHAAVMAAACVRDRLPIDDEAALDRFARSIGLAFQIRDDLLDVEGETATLGKNAGADERLGKATWPALFGVAAARKHCADLLADAMESLERFGDAADPLRRIADYIVARHH